MYVVSLLVILTRDVMYLGILNVIVIRDCDVFALCFGLVDKGFRHDMDVPSAWVEVLKLLTLNIRLVVFASA